MKQPVYLASPVNLDGGDRYWLEVDLDSKSEGWWAYMCVFPMAYYTQVWLNNGEPPWDPGDVVFDYPADMFFEIHSVGIALERSTWANIKSGT